MTQLRLLVRLAILLLATALPATAADTPNFIVINIDDLGYSDIGPFGSKLNRTPALDQMAKEGMKLTSFYAAPVCSPSRASLMTGCYPKRALPIPHVLFPGNDVGMHPDELTVAELLKEQGYATGIFGKWHLGDQTPFLPTRQGFDVYYGIPYSNDMGPASEGVKSDLGAPLATTRPIQGKGQPPLPWLRNETVLKRVLPDDQQSMVELSPPRRSTSSSRTRTEGSFSTCPTRPSTFRSIPARLSPAKARMATTATGSRKWTGASAKCWTRCASRGWKRTRW